jgi:DNA-binding NtrC family response regulator
MSDQHQSVDYRLLPNVESSPGVTSTTDQRSNEALDRSPTTLTIQVGTALKDVERLVIEATLKYTGHNISNAARILRIDRSTLHAKIKQYWSSRT